MLGHHIFRGNLLISFLYCLLTLLIVFNVNATQQQASNPTNLTPKNNSGGIKNLEAQCGNNIEVQNEVVLTCKGHNKIVKSDACYNLCNGNNAMQSFLALHLLMRLEKEACMLEVFVRENQDLKRICNDVYGVTEEMTKKSQSIFQLYDENGKIHPYIIQSHAQSKAVDHNILRYARKMNYTSPLNLAEIMQIVGKGDVENFQHDIFNQEQLKTQTPLAPTTYITIVSDVTLSQVVPAASVEAGTTPSLISSYLARTPITESKTSQQIHPSALSENLNFPERVNALNQNSGAATKLIKRSFEDRDNHVNDGVNYIGRIGNYNSFDPKTERQVMNSISETETSIISDYSTINFTPSPSNVGISSITPSLLTKKETVSADTLDEGVQPMDKASIIPSIMSLDSDVSPLQINNILSSTQEVVNADTTTIGTPPTVLPADSVVYPATPVSDSSSVVGSEGTSTQTQKKPCPMSKQVYLKNKKMWEDIANIASQMGYVGTQSLYITTLINKYEKKARYLKNFVTTHPGTMLKRPLAFGEAVLFSKIICNELNDLKKAAVEKRLNEHAKTFKEYTSVYLIGEPLKPLENISVPSDDSYPVWSHNIKNDDDYNKNSDYDKQRVLHDDHNTKNILSTYQENNDKTETQTTAISPNSDILETNKAVVDEAVTSTKKSSESAINTDKEGSDAAVVAAQSANTTDVKGKSAGSTTASNFSLLLLLFGVIFATTSF